MQHLHARHSLRPLGPFSNARVDKQPSALGIFRDGAGEDDAPGDGGDGIVEDQVALVKGRRLLLGLRDRSGSHCADLGW